MMVSALQFLDDPFPEPVSIRLFLKRDDLLHPTISGNKWRKLTYNLEAARQRGIPTLLTFGGAYSNHLYAVAAAGQSFGFQTIGIVRGEELANKPRNKTLLFCEANGMQLAFVSRLDYRRKEEASYQQALQERFGNCLILPEGGTNALAIQGAADIIPEIEQQLGYTPDYVCCPVGTGGTVAGLAQSAAPQTQVLGFMALKLEGSETVQLPGLSLVNRQPALIKPYHFGGYAKTTPELLAFIRAFEHKTGVLLDQVYTGKMLFGIYDLARQGYFPAGAHVVAVHTGGLQGRSEMLP